jgi:hypothetical protein
MKKIIKTIILLTAILFALISTSTSCEKQQTESVTEREKEIAARLVAGIVGFSENDTISWAFDGRDIHAVTEHTSQIVLCRIENLEKVSLDYRFAQLSFVYEVIIEDIYMDINNLLNIGDRITVSSIKGIITGNEYKKLAESAYSRTRASSHVQEFSNREYEENEYILSTSFNSVPCEAGRSYIMYLLDDWVEENDIYSESGYEFAYEYTDGILYYGIDYERMDIDIIQLKEQIEQIVNDVKIAINKKFMAEYDRL